MQAGGNHTSSQGPGLNPPPPSPSYLASQPVLQVSVRHELIDEALAAALMGVAQQLYHAGVLDAARQLHLVVELTKALQAGMVQHLASQGAGRTGRVQGAGHTGRVQGAGCRPHRQGLGCRVQAAQAGFRAGGGEDSEEAQVLGCMRRPVKGQSRSRRLQVSIARGFGGQHCARVWGFGADGY